MEIRIYQLVTYNHASFHLRRKENLLSNQKASKYYEHDCLQNFILLIMSLLTGLVDNSSHILPGIYFTQGLLDVPSKNLIEKEDFRIQALMKKLIFLIELFFCSSLYRARKKNKYLCL